MSHTKARFPGSSAKAARREPVSASQQGLWAIGLLSFALAWIALGHTGRSLAFANAAPRLALMLMGGGIFLVRTRLDSDRAIRCADTLELLALFGLLSASGALASYFVAAVSWGYADDTLAKVGPLVGFSWPQFYAFTAQHMPIIVIGQAAYLSIFWLPFVVLAGCGATRRTEWGRTILLAVAIALALTMLLFYAFPAKGALGHFGARPDYMPISRFDEIVIIQTLREGGMTVIDIGQLKGIVNFPSFHASAAILFMWGAWPIRQIRWPVLITCVLMLIATPVEGTHYLADVFGGIFVALVAIVVVSMPTVIEQWRRIPRGTSSAAIAEQAIR